MFINRKPLPTPNASVEIYIHLFPFTTSVTRFRLNILAFQQKMEKKSNIIGRYIQRSVRKTRLRLEEQKEMAKKKRIKSAVKINTNSLKLHDS